MAAHLTLSEAASVPSAAMPCARGVRGLPFWTESACGRPSSHGFAPLAPEEVLRETGLLGASVIGGVLPCLLGQETPLQPHQLLRSRGISEFL